MQTSGPIVIAGFMGCGKTAVAGKLAVRLKCKMRDLDDAITRREGRSPARIIEEDGERAFRAIETRSLRDVLNDRSIRVIALGGGAWINEINRDLIRQKAGVSVWLDAPFEVCWERISQSGDNRPLGSSKEQARILYERRRPVYQLAHLRLEANKSVSLDDLAGSIEGQLAHLTAS